MGFNNTFRYTMVKCLWYLSVLCFHWNNQYETVHAFCGIYIVSHNNFFHSNAYSTVLNFNLISDTLIHPSIHLDTKCQTV